MIVSAESLRSPRNRNMPRCCQGMCFLDRPADALLNSAPASHQTDDRHDDGDHQQEVNKTAGNVKSPTQQPQDEQDRKNCPEHGFIPQCGQDLPLGPRRDEKRGVSTGVGRNTRSMNFCELNRHSWTILTGKHTAGQDALRSYAHVRPSLQRNAVTG